MGISCFPGLRPYLLRAVLVIAIIATNCRAVEFSKVGYAGNTYTVCRVNVRSEKLELFHRNEIGQPIKRFSQLAPWLDARGRKLVFAMNAGMFHRDLSAVGLYVANGQQIVPLNTADAEGNFFLKPNGVFAVTTDGARIVETSAYPKLRERVLLATQSGPLLVMASKIHPAFKADSTSRLHRNGVGVPSPDTALFVITDAPVNFHEFALFFRDKLGCADALFLDGTISSLYAPALKRNDFRRNLGPMIGVTE